MKNIKFIQLIFTILLVFGLSSCDDRELVNIDQGNAPIVVDLSTSNLFLDANYPDNPALTVSWSAATYSIPVEVKYTVQVSADQNFSNPEDLVSTNQSVRTVALTTAQVNAGAQAIGLTPFVPSKMYIRVFSSLGNGSMVQTSNVSSLIVTPYKLVYPDFYLVGEASYVGWNAGQAQLLDKDDKFSFMYTYLEKDKSFRFLGQQDWSPINYSIDADGIKDDYKYFRQVSSNIKKADGDNENMSFTGDTGIYKVTINADKTVKSLSAVASSIPGFDFPNLYVMGDIAGDGTPEHAIAMTKTGVGVFEYTTTIKPGQKFKFIGQQAAGDLEWGNIVSDGNSGYLGPKSDSGNIVFNGDEASYKITVNLKAGIYTLVKL